MTYSGGEALVEPSTSLLDVITVIGVLKALEIGESDFVSRISKSLMQWSRQDVP